MAGELATDAKVWSWNFSDEWEYLYVKKYAEVDTRSIDTTIYTNRVQHAMTPWVLEVMTWTSMIIIVLGIHDLLLDS